jgi:hypothetical protein
MLPDWFVCSKCGKKPPEVREFHFGDEAVCSLCKPPKEKRKEPMKCSQIVIHYIGGIWEEKEWEVWYDFPLRWPPGWSEGDKKCPHVIPGGEHGICPRVVVARNEGGESSTGICLDCIIEAVKALPPRTSETHHSEKG